MKPDYLTERELEMIVRRARGEYAVHEIAARIHREKGKDAPRDCPYMAFLHVVCARREPAWSEIEPVMRAVLALHPSKPAEPVAPKKRKRTVRVPITAEEAAAIDLQNRNPVDSVEVPMGAVVPVTADFDGPVIGTAKLTKQPDGTVTAEGTIAGPLEGSKIGDAIKAALSKPWKTAER